jgi:hypothetical protein
MMTREQSLEHTPPYRRQPFFASGANRFGVGYRVVRAAPVIVVRLGKYRVRGSSGHVFRLPTQV